jgi:hypothetical protein
MMDASTQHVVGGDAHDDDATEQITTEQITTEQIANDAPPTPLSSPATTSLPVLGKVECIYEYVRDENGRPTGATREQLAIHPQNPIVTAKFDGTCCYIQNGQVFARQDVKHDASNAPPGWFQTAAKDKGGHIIGFRPLDRGDKWHFKPIDGPNCRFLEYDAVRKEFFYVMRPIADFNGYTAELVGPSVNGNKHKLTENAYIIHGSVVVDAPWHCRAELQAWLAGEGKIYEGIVIHDVGNNTLAKCHRGHLGGSNTWKAAVPLPMRAVTDDAR